MAKEISVFKSKRPLRVGVFGLGISNLSAIAKLRKTHTDLHISLRYDGKCIDKTKIPPDWKVDFYEGENVYSDITEEILFLSPSVRRDAPPLKEAAARGVILSSDAELFFEGLPKYGVLPYSGKRYAVTGSDGKSSVTALSAAMLGDGAIPCGNFGRGFSSLPDGAVPVCELSSFQLLPFSPNVDRAVITNVTENHLNWHRDFAEYRKAKERLFENAKERILSADAEGVAFLREKYPLFCLVSKKDGETPDAWRAEHLLTVKDETVLLDGEPYVSLARAHRKSETAKENFLFAIAMTLEDAEREQVQKVIDRFEGLPHRCREIAKDGEVAWYDSSVDSTPIRAATTLKERTKPAVAIVGGKGKNLSYSPLTDALCAFAKAAVLLGENAYEIAVNLEKRGFRYTFAEDMADAVAKADALAEGKYDVILTPASTSFDRYRDYTDRGNDYQEKVKSYLQEKHNSKGIFK